MLDLLVHKGFNSIVRKPDNFSDAETGYCLTSVQLLK